MKMQCHNYILSRSYCFYISTTFHTLAYGRTLLVVVIVVTPSVRWEINGFHNIDPHYFLYYYIIMRWLKCDTLLLVDRSADDQRRHIQTPPLSAITVKYSRFFMRLIDLSVWLLKKS